MPSARGQQPFRDRHADLASLGAHALKPPVLGRKLLSRVCLVALLLVAYGTVGPVGLDRGPWINTAAPHQLVPSSVETDHNDVFTNFVVFLPVGAALRLLLRRRGVPGFVDFWLAVLLAGGLSWGAEWTQQFIPARSASRIDIVINSIGAAFGGLLAPLAQHVVRRGHAYVYYAWHLRPWTLVSQIAVGVATLLMVVPLDFGPAAISFDLLRDLDVTDVRRMVVFALVGFALTAGLARKAESSVEAARAGAWRAAALALLLEICQSVLISHEACVFEMIVSTVGGLMGCVTAWVFIDSGTLPLGAPRSNARPPDSREHYSKRLIEHAERFRPYAGLLLLLTLPLGVLPQLWGLSDDAHVRHALLAWLPFQAHFYAPFHEVVAEVFEAVLVYGFLAVLCLFISPEQGRKLGALLLTGLVATVELYRWSHPGMHADLTAACLAALAWIVADHVWRALEPRLLPAPLSAHNAR